MSPNAGETEPKVLDAPLATAPGSRNALHVVVKGASRGLRGNVIPNDEGTVCEAGGITHLRHGERARILERVVWHGKGSRDRIDEARVATLAAAEEEAYARRNPRDNDADSEEGASNCTSVREEPTMESSVSDTIQVHALGDLPSPGALVNAPNARWVSNNVRNTDALAIWLRRYPNAREYGRLRD